MLGWTAVFLFMTALDGNVSPKQSRSAALVVAAASPMPPPPPPPPELPVPSGPASLINADAVGEPSSKDHAALLTMLVIGSAALFGALFVAAGAAVLLHRIDGRLHTMRLMQMTHNTAVRTSGSTPTSSGSHDADGIAANSYVPFELDLHGAQWPQRFTQQPFQVHSAAVAGSVVTAAALAAGCRPVPRRAAPSRPHAAPPLRSAPEEPTTSVIEPAPLAAVMQAVEAAAAGTSAPAVEEVASAPAEPPPPPPRRRYSPGPARSSGVSSGDDATPPPSHDFTGGLRKMGPKSRYPTPSGYPPEVPPTIPEEAVSEPCAYVPPRQAAAHR